MIQLNKVSMLGLGLACVAGCTTSAKTAADSTSTAAAAAAATVSTAAPNTAADEQAIRDVNLAWFKAYNAHDAAALAALYADDAVLYMPGIPMVRGHDAIKTAYEKDLDAMTKAGYANNKGTSSEAGASGDIGWESDTFTVTDKSGKKIDTGKYITVFARKDGKWQIARDIWNSDMPAAPVK